MPVRDPTGFSPNSHPMSSRRSLDKITHIVVHCSASPNGRHTTARDIDQWHGPGRISQGRAPFTRTKSVAPYHRPDLKHIGYHIVNRVDGRVERGRSFRETGAHCPQHGMNRVAIAIVMIGFDKFVPSQWENLRRQVRALTAQFGLITIGHRDVNPLKCCPCFDATEWISNGYQPNPENILELHVA